MPPKSPWWTPHVHRDRRPFLLMRNRIKAGLREGFATRGFLEVDTACLQVSPGNETHLHAFRTEIVGPGLERQALYLHTSPEFAMKKLLAAGEEKIFSFAPVFRNRERGALHHPEFTMLEWYRTGADYGALMDDCAQILRVASEIAGTRSVAFRGRACDPHAEPERLTVADAFSRYAGIDLPPLAGDRDAFAESAQASGLTVRAHDGWSDIFSRVLAAHIEPKLGLERPTLLFDYPASEAALARTRPDNPLVSERFELYVCGVEIANGFAELTDAAEQRRRLEAQMVEKARVYGERYPIDEDFLAALACMPPASGCALGFDRLVMLAAGAERIDQVIWTPVADPA